MESTRLNNQSLNPFKDLAALSELYAIVRRHRPDVVMGYTHKPALYSAFAGKLASVPHVTMMVTGLGFGFEPGGGVLGRIVPPITRSLFRVGCAASDVVIFHNQDNAKFFLAERLMRDASKQVVVGGSGVDLSHYCPQPIEPVPPAEITFLLIARIVRYKGILEYAQAAKALRKRYPNAQFLLAGYRDQNPLAYSDSEWRTILEQVEYLGPCGDVRELYRKAHVYVLPSYGEGMPRTVLEAMATGRPIITTDTYGCRDPVEEGVNGYCVPVRDPKSLEAAMERFLSGSSSVSDMGAASQLRARELFDVDKVNLDMLAALGLGCPSTGSAQATRRCSAPGSCPAVRFGRGGGSMKPGVLVLSLDFELMWGVHQSKGGEYHSNILAVHDIVPKLLALFAKYEVHCTWAAVGALCAKSKSELLAALPKRRPAYKSPEVSSYYYLDRVEENSRLHFASHLIEKILAAPFQELASHTMTHYYCGELGQDVDDFAADIEACQEVLRGFGAHATSMVFPRNQYSVDYLKLLGKHGFRCFRGLEENWVENIADPRVRRYLLFIDSYIGISGDNTYPRDQITLSKWPIHNVKSSLFFRPFSGRRVLEALKMKRAKEHIRIAAETGRVVHVWCHPHNFGGNVEKSMAQFEDFLRYFAQMRNRHGMVSMNMGELSREVSP